MKRITFLFCLLVLPSSLAAQEQKFPRGAKPTPAHKIVAATAAGKVKVHLPIVAAPPQIAMIPSRLSYWGNDRYGICVSAESAFAIGAYSKFAGQETYITEPEIISWARAHGVLNGADLLSVIEDMQRDGVRDEKGVLRKEGVASVVNYGNEANLQAAIATGPISIAIAADALPSGAGNKSGWYAFGGRAYRNTDHCVSLLGYGPAKFCFDSLNVTMPANAPTGTCYLLFTWNTIGVVDHKWIMNTCEEAWLRTPTVVGLPPPQPPDPPAPPDPPPGSLTITPAVVTLAPGKTQQFVITPAGTYSWSASAGTVTADGVYTAPAGIGSYTVSANAPGNPAQYAIAKVTVSTVPTPVDGATIILTKPLPPGTYQIVPGGIKAVEPMKPAEDEEEPVKDEPCCMTSYDAAMQKAITSRKPLVVGVGCEPPAGDWITCRVESPWHTWRKPVVILSTPARIDGWEFLEFVAELPPGSSADAVAKLFKKRAAYNPAKQKTFQTR